MKFLDRLDRKIGKYAIKGLMLYIIVLNFSVYLIGLLNPNLDVTGKLILDPHLVMKGEIWRLITFLFLPPEANILWIFFIMYFYYMVGTSLEHEWGSFKFNTYYLIGVLGTIAGAFIAGGGATPVYLNLSLFLAFAAVYPNYQILLFFILPVKVKWLAWLDGAFLAYTFVMGSVSVKLMITAAILNFVLFFGKDFILGLRHNGFSFVKKQKYKKGIVIKGAFHRCTICGITELEDKTMEFRYCKDCDGDYEYCMPHLKEHTHIKHTH